MSVTLLSPAPSFGASGSYTTKQGERKLKLKPRCFKCDAVYEYRRYIQKLENIVGKENFRCAVCGYNKCYGALDFHHLDPIKKDFEIAKLRNYSEAMLRVEISKCIILCKVHHVELHMGVLNFAGLV